MKPLGGSGDVYNGFNVGMGCILGNVKNHFFRHGPWPPVLSSSSACVFQKMMGAQDSIHDLNVPRDSHVLHGHKGQVGYM